MRLTVVTAALGLVTRTGDAQTAPKKGGVLLEIRLKEPSGSLPTILPQVVDSAGPYMHFRNVWLDKR